MNKQHQNAQMLELYVVLCVIIFYVMRFITQYCGQWLVIIFV